MKKLLTILLVVGMLLFMTAVAADEEVYTEGFFYYTIEDKSITIVGYFGNEIEVTVPASIAGIPVNAIGPNAFADTSVQILNLPDTIRELGENATGTADVRFIGQTASTSESQTAAPSSAPQNTGIPKEPETDPSPMSADKNSEEIGGAEPVETDARQEISALTTPNSSEPPAPVEPVAEASTVPIGDETVTAAPTGPKKPSEPEAPAGQVKNLTWLWVTLGAVAAGGAATAGVITAKKKRN